RGMELQNTQVKLLPPNCTSRLQPCIIDFSNEEEIEQESENELVAVIERGVAALSETEEPLDDASIICLVQEENNDEKQNEEEDSDEE
ncbi:12762_t:CDS:2, partial [Entrophospora sp. SA101]